MKRTFEIDMTVREFLMLWSRNPKVRIYCADVYEGFIHLKTDFVNNLLNANYDFLDVPVAYTFLDGDVIAIIVR